MRKKKERGGYYRIRVKSNIRRGRKEGMRRRKRKRMMKIRRMERRKRSRGGRQ